MSKIILFNTEARVKLKKGVDTVANAVKVTLGPKGRNVIIEQPYGGSNITKDGVSVAKSINLTDPVENIGAQMLKDVATKTVDISGDGTTSSTVLAQEIITQGFKLLAAGSNPMDLKKGIDLAVVNVVDTLKKQSKEVGTSLEEIKHIATISANGEQVIGDLIAEAFSKVGKDGVITVEESKNSETTIDVVEGMKLDRGYLSPYFATNPEKMRVELQKPYILIYDRKIDTMKPLMGILEKVAVAGRSLLIICEDLDGEALQSLVHNKMTGKLKVCVIKCPGFGENKRDVLQDVAIMTNGVYISSDQGMKLESTDLVDLGEADNIIVDKDTTLIVGGVGDKELIKTRVLQIKSQIANVKLPSDKIIYSNRLAKLSGGVAVLYVGAATEVEMKEKKDRVDDALHATRAAVEEGIVPGGGVALIRCLESLKPLLIANNDISVGSSVIYTAIQAPLKTMLINSDEALTDIVSKVISGKDDYGYNIRTGTFENFYTTGVLDPTKVVRVALENAASIAGMLLTTECVIANEININNK